LEYTEYGDDKLISPQQVIQGRSKKIKNKNMPKIENPCPQCNKEMELIESVEEKYGCYFWYKWCLVSEYFIIKQKKDDNN